MVVDRVKPKLPFYFIIAVATWLQHPTGQQTVANRGKKWDFKETFLFLKITFWKKKTLTSLVNYSTFLSLTGITFQE